MAQMNRASMKRAAFCRFGDFDRLAQGLSAWCMGNDEPCNCRSIILSEANAPIWSVDGKVVLNPHD